MPMIPTTIQDQGYEAVGLLSALYSIRATGTFFAGLFIKENMLHLGIRSADDEHWVMPVRESEVESLLKGELSLFDLIRATKSLLRIPGDGQPVEQKTKLIFKMFYQMALGKVKTLPNAYYLWNEFHFSRELKKHHAYQ
jgi:hypothetical protein